MKNIFWSFLISVLMISTSYGGAVLKQAARGIVPAINKEYYDLAARLIVLAGAEYKGLAQKTWETVPNHAKLLEDARKAISGGGEKWSGKVQKRIDDKDGIGALALLVAESDAATKISPTKAAGLENAIEKYLRS